jgi:probable addiction module antidote protein
MTIETEPFDVVEVLNSEERISAYLEDAFESGDPSIIASAIGDVVRSRNLSALANNAGLARESVPKAFSADGDPTLSAMTAMMKSLGFRLSFAPIDRAAE